MSAVLKHRIAAYWDTRCRSYTNGTGGFCREERAVWWDELKGIVPGDEPLKILDTGTGLGFLALLFAEKGHAVTGLDIATAMLRGACDNACELGFSTAFVRGDAEYLPFREHSFDLVISKYLLWTLPSPERVLEEWKRIVKPGGRIIAIDGLWFSTAASHAARRAVAGFIRRVAEGAPPTGFCRHYRDVKDHLPLYAQRDTGTVLQLFKDAGLDVVDLVPLTGVHRYLQKTAPLSHTVQYPDPPFLISGICRE